MSQTDFTATNAPALDVGGYLRFGQVMDQVERAQRELVDWLQKASEVPADGENLISGASGSSGDLVILVPLLDPQPGRVHLLRRVTVGGQLYSTTAAGTCLLIKTGSPPNPLNLDTGSIVAAFGSLPTTQFYSNEQIAVHFPDNIFVAIKTPTASTTYVARAGYVDYEEGAYKRVKTL